MNVSPSEKVESKKQEIITFLRNYILEQELQENDKLPSENFLAEKFQTNRNTVRGALMILKGQGLVFSKKGKGFFVAETPKPLVYRHDNSLGFSEILNQGTRNYKSKVLSLELRAATEEEADKLQIEAGESVYHLKQLRFVYDKKMAVCLSILPEKRVPKLEEHTKNFQGVNHILINGYHLPHPTCKWINLQAALPSYEEMELLEISEHMPILEQQNVFVIDGIGPIEYFIVRARGDMLHFSMEFR